MILEHGTWIVTADGGGAVIYRNTGHEGLARLEVVETHNAHHAAFTRDLGTDKPGRYKTPAGGKTAVAGPDYHDQAEHDFAKRLASRLDELVGAHVHAKSQPPMVLFASPRFLGMIRPAYSARRKAILKAEVGKDLREAPTAKVEHALAELDHA